MKKIAVLTDFLDFPMQYGVVPAVLNQLRVLKRLGYDPHLLVVEGTNNEPSMSLVPEGITVKPVVPFIHLYDYQLGTQVQEHNVTPIGEHHEPRNKTHLKKQIKYCEEMLEPILKEYDIVIEHDILFQTWKIPYNHAIRNIAERTPQIQWIHWCHSAPSIPPDEIKYPHTLRFTPMPNSIWVTMNEAQRAGFARQYQVPISQVKAVPHPIDIPKHYRFHELSKRMWDEYELWRDELIVVCVTRFDHAKQKGAYKVAEFVSELRKFASTRLIYVNSWSNTKGAEHHIKQLRNIIPDAIFTSEQGKEYQNGVPHEVVVDMLHISNIHIMASSAETYSFTLMEAALGKNLIAMNGLLKSITYLMPDSCAMYVPWYVDCGGEKITPEYNPSEQRFMYDRAKELYEEYIRNKALKAHRHVIRNYSSEAVMLHYRALLGE